MTLAATREEDSAVDLAGIRAVIAEDREAFDARCDLTERASAAITGSPLMRWVLPEDYGGVRGAVLEWFQQCREVAAVDGSAGWIAAQGSAQNVMIASQAAPEFAADFFANPYANAAIALSGNAVLTATSAGGYSVTGSWTLASGASGATFVGGTASFADPQLAPDAGLSVVLLSPEQVRIERTWNPVGLRGTGSHDVKVEGAVVPPEQVVTLFNRGAAYRQEVAPLGSSSVLIGVACAAVQLGIARRALDLATSILCDKPQSPFMPAPMVEHPGTVRDLAAAEGNWYGANAGVEAALGDLDMALRNGGDERDAKLRARLASTTAAQSSVGVVRTVYDLCGTDASATPGELGRCFRDVHVLTAHPMARRRSYEALGRLMLGVERPADLFGL